tara:strand:+ start:703 stop:1020 length:318 start_codon:yes stop_codon:yes gene_type:complete
MIMNIELKQALSTYIESITDLSDYDEGLTLTRIMYLEADYFGVEGVEKWLRGLPSCLGVEFYNDECIGVLSTWLLVDPNLLINNNLNARYGRTIYFKVLAAFLTD